MKEFVIKYLHHIEFVCPEITKEELSQFSKGLKVLQLKKGECFINNGDFQKQGGFLIEGLIRAYHIDKNGNERNIYFIPENEYTFHYASLMESKPCPLTFECIEPSTIVTFTTEHLNEAYQQIPSFEKYGRRIVEQKYKQQQIRLEGFLYKNAEERYIDFVNDFPHIFNRISVSQLCSYLGVERQTLTRIRKKIY